MAEPMSRALRATGRHGGAARPRRCCCWHGVFQLGLPGGLPVAHGAGGLSHRRRAAGRHRHARRHARAGHCRRTLPLQQLVELARQLAAGRHGAKRRCRLAVLALHVGRQALRAARCRWRLAAGDRRHRRQRRLRFRAARHRGASARWPAGCRRWAFPTLAWREVLALLPVAASCVVIIIAQSAATSRSFAQRHGETVDVNRDLLGLSAANAAAACSGAFVVNGSPTQTAHGRPGRRAQPAGAVDLRRRDAWRAAVADAARCSTCRAACWRHWCSPSRCA